MKNFQQIIKYLALAFAIYLIFNILSGIMYGVSSISNIFVDDKEVIENLKDLKVNKDTILLDIDLSSTNVTIKSGESFKVETNNKYINTKQDNNKLYIKEKSHYINNTNNELIIYIPNNYLFDKVSIETGAGKVYIDLLSTKELYLTLGAGKVSINNLNVLDKAEIEGGAGEVNIKGTDINNLNLEMGVGKLSLTSKLSGNNEIDSGIGALNLNLMGTLEDYTISVDKGIGVTKIDGKDIEDSKKYGRGNNKIDIDGGIGSINIDFK